MRTIKIHLDDRMHSQKPDKKEAALISQRITEKETEIDVTAFAKEVGENGRTFTPALFHGGRKKENFMRQQAFALDFDGGIDLDAFLSRAERYKALPAFVYETFSGAQDNPRFRAVFINDCVVEEERVSFIITKLLFQIFPESDKCCHDASRMFFGGKGILYENINAEINLKDLAISAQEKTQRENSHNYARNVNSLGRDLGVEVRNNSLCIHRSIELGENEENRTATGIIRVNAQDSSKSYIIEKNTGKHPKSIRFDEGFQIMRNKSCNEIANACPLFRDFYQSDLHHSLKFCLATNLRFIKGGRKFFFDGLKDGHERWEMQWKYIKAHGYRPMRRKAAGCPYADRCGCVSLYDKLGRKIQKIADRENYVPLEEAVEILHEALERALRSRSDGIHLIKAQTAIGKTTAYCKMARYRMEGKPLMIARPRICFKTRCTAACALPACSHIRR